MTDIRAGDAALDEEDRLPWLEAVEEEEGGDGPSVLKLIVAVLIGLAAIGGLVGGLFWLNQRGGAGPGGSPEIIKAPPGAYKVRPDDPGGMKVEGEGDTAFNTAQGANPSGSIDTNAVPETPVKGRAKGADEPLLKAPAPTNAPATTATPPAAGGGTIQLGAFPDGASAEKAWKAMSGRFAYLAPLSHSVVSANVNGKTWYRLRASGPGAAGVCGRLKVAGENCLKVD
jgi:hypothetical protein